MENLFKKRQDRLHVFESFRNPNAKMAQATRKFLIMYLKHAITAVKISLTSNCSEPIMYVLAAAVI